MIGLTVPVVGVKRALPLVKCTTILLHNPSIARQARHTVRCAWARSRNCFACAVTSLRHQLPSRLSGQIYRHTRHHTAFTRRILHTGCYPYRCRNGHRFIVVGHRNRQTYARIGRVPVISSVGVTRCIPTSIILPITSIILHPTSIILPPPTLSYL